MTTNRTAQTAAPAFDAQLAEATWSVMTATQRAAWITSIQSRLAEIPEADVDAWLAFLTGKLAA